VPTRQARSPLGVFDLQQFATAAVAGVVAGVVLAGVVVAVLIAVGAMRVGSADSSKAKVDTKAIVLPDGLGGFQDTVAASTAKGGSPANIAKLKARLDKVASLTTDAYEQAYGGAAAAVRAYSDASLEHSATVIAVRASAPGLTDGVVQDAESLGLAVPFEAIGQFGDVSCTVHQPRPCLQARPSTRTMPSTRSASVRDPV